MNLGVHPPDTGLQGLTAGVDEAGRGPLAGPVCAAAVILNPRHPIAGIADSKTLSAVRREQLAALIRDQALAWSIAWASVEEIDRLNILRASLLAMQRAVAGLKLSPTQVLIDGNHCPALPLPVEAVVGGDRLVPAISAASILAKVARDRFMVELDAQCPGYGFAKHKGYPTAEHRAAIERLGPSPYHRLSFRLHVKTDQ
ncbi:ribonuclease HII [Caldichromatium japonicum]|uniref:Ribonuclease HII n=1 Tax=Caldichromatium japonicum TaxID=2699430 RepID=A0A6G7VBL6_9GAMM|nr:ribonuclease HII [Caldichromatium japonicum]QIK37300.1 ribonuclease HII [Caldichromatium japonicum]